VTAMKARYFFTSVTRIADLKRRPFRVTALPREEWATGDYVVGLVRSTPHYPTELDSGRMISNMEGDLLIGAFGRRNATLEGVGDWESIGSDGRMHALTGAGLFARATSKSPFLSDFTELDYLGHVVRDQGKLTMQQFALKNCGEVLRLPVVLLVGTSMSAGKTTTGRIIIHELAKAGLRVGGAKLTGASRYRDVQSFLDAGAQAIFDFVDVGLPSTVCPEAEFRRALASLLSYIAAANLDVLVAEAGASPLEPYNGAAAIDMLGDNVRCTVLCASDPYAVVGVETAFRIKPDLVAGPATTTRAASDLVRRLTGDYALDLIDPQNLPALRELLGRTLGFEIAAGPTVPCPCPGAPGSC
jgi:hypothetical protein